MVKHKGNLRPRRKGKRKQGQICILKEMMTENFPLIKDNKLQIQAEQKHTHTYTHRERQREHIHTKTDDNKTAENQN